MTLFTTHLTLASDAAIDLQMHTTHSDGAWQPEQLLDYLVQEQFGLVAITDHDHTDALVALQQLAIRKKQPVLVAVEMTTMWHDDITDLLCFGFDPENNALNALAQDVLRRQRNNTREVFEYLTRKGYTFDSEPEALNTILDMPSPQQLHALVALVKRHGYGTGQPSAGKIVLEAGGEFASTDPGAVVEAAHRSGAVCLIAHPGRDNGFVTFNPQLLDEFRRAFPIDGLEVYYPKHTPEQVAMYSEYAERHNLLVSAGSDSHAPDNPPIKYRAEICRALLNRVGVQVI